MELAKSPFSGNLYFNLAKAYGKYTEIIQLLAVKIGTCDSNKETFSIEEEIYLAYKVFINALASDPNKLIKLQSKFLENYINIITNINERLLGLSTKPLYRADSDKRFLDPRWQDNLYFNFFQQVYIMLCEWVEKAIKDSNFENITSKRKVYFYIRQFLNFISPTNFILTNPKVIQEINSTEGENLVKCMDQLLDDIKCDRSIYNIQTTNKDNFNLGHNLAITKGQIIFQNDLMQLIQYQPLKKKNYPVPILFVPPFINKYYILDLSPQNSIVKWLLEQGYSVFMISWINPGKELAHKNFEHYMLEGPLTVLNVIEKMYNIQSVSAIGYCIGGTLLAATLGYMKKKNDTRIKTATLLATLLDFQDVGDISVFLDEASINKIQNSCNQKGYLDGANIYATFNSLRANDMVWSFFINNYLLGQKLNDFDILYWNSDNTRLPAELCNFYFENMYLHNLLKQPNKIILDSVPIDLSLVDTPIYILAAKSDHIVPWKSCFGSTRIFNKNVRFVLATSGHVAGVINHPSSNKYSYFINDSVKEKAEDWLSQAQEIQGSWWNNWNEWNKLYAGEMKQSISSTKIKPYIIEEAPGTYVQMA